MRITIYGGSFSPIHKGHIALAKKVINENLADEVWLMVSPHNPLKAVDELWPIELRLKLCLKAVENEKKIKVSDIETHLKKPSYTYDTLQALSKLYPKNEFTLLIGSDNWACFNKWANYQKILDNYHILVYPRQGYKIDEATLPSQVKILNAPLLPYSSTEIRKLLGKSLSVKDMLPDGVGDLVEELTHQKISSL